MFYSFAADLSAILNNDISDIAENVEIPVPDSTDDFDEPRIKYSSSVVSHQQVNHHHIHVHVPPTSQSSEDTFESMCARGKSGQHEIRPLMQTRKLIFDSSTVVALELVVISTRLNVISTRLNVISTRLNVQFGADAVR